MKTLVQFLSESKMSTTVKKLMRVIIGDNPYDKEYLGDDVFYDLAEAHTNGDLSKLGNWLKEHDNDKIDVNVERNGELWNLTFELGGVNCEIDVTEKPKFR